MKKQFLYTLLVVLFSFFGASTTKAQDMFPKGGNIIQAGLGLGTYYGYYYGFSPLISVAYDHCFFENVGPGNIAIGAFGGFRTSKYQLSSDRFTFLTFGLRGAYYPHFAELLNGKFHAYAGIAFGARIEKWSGDSAYSYAASNGPVAGPFVGARYFFSPAFGVYAEAGYVLGYLNAGVSLKF